MTPVASEAALQSILAQATHLPFPVLCGWLERLLAPGTGERRVPRSAEIDGASEHGALASRALHVAHARESALRPQDESRQQAPIRFRHDPSLTFHAADIVSARLVEVAGEARYVELTTCFAGLTGAASPLPPAIIEPLCRDDDDETALQREFLDLFHHRLLSLFRRGLLKFDLPRSSAPDGSGRTLDWVLLLAGLMPDHAERVTGLARSQLLALAPLLVTYPPNAQRIVVAIRHVLGDVVAGAEVRIVELQGTFVRLHESALPRLGVDFRLGHTASLGRRAHSPASEVTVHIGPLGPEACARLRPGGDRSGVLRVVTSLFCPETVQVAVELMPSEVCPARLGNRQSRLGRDTWLTSRGRPRPVRFVLPQRCVHPV